MKQIIILGGNNIITMFDSLPHGIKISIARSISNSFLKYMENIGWDEKKYNLEDFIIYWRDYAQKNALWFVKIDDEMKSSPDFHKGLAEKMNEVIEKILTEAPTEKEIRELDGLIKQLRIDDIDYTCRMEAKYHIERLKKKLKS
jgi:hypothetical protein